MRVRYKKRFLKEAPQQTLNLALLCLQVLIAHRELEIGKLREIIAPNWTCCEGVARPGR